MTGQELDNKPIRKTGSNDAWRMWKISYVDPAVVSVGFRRFITLLFTSSIYKLKDIPQAWTGVAQVTVSTFYVSVGRFTQACFSVRADSTGDKLYTFEQQGISSESCRVIVK